MEIEITKISTEIDSVDLRPSVDFAKLLNDILGHIRMSHWYTNNYNFHLLSGNLYDSLNDLFDKLQEEIIGTIKNKTTLFPIFNISQEVGNLPEDYESCDRFIFYIKLMHTILDSLALKHYIEDCGSNGLNNTVEEIKSEINKALYLFNMINPN